MGSRFKVRWTEANATLPFSSSSLTSVNVQVLSNETTTITNPGYPGYENNMNIEWILESPENTRIKLLFV
jgi:hypothetical protein